MQKWEYNELSRGEISQRGGIGEFRQGMVRLGEEGWELVAVIPGADKWGSTFYFKRPKARAKRGAAKAPRAR